MSDKDKTDQSNERLMVELEPILAGMVSAIVPAQTKGLEEGRTIVWIRGYDGYWGVKSVTSIQGGDSGDLAGLIESWKARAAKAREVGTSTDAAFARGLYLCADELEARTAAAPPGWRQVNEVLNYDTMRPYFDGDRQHLTEFLARARKLVRAVLDPESDVADEAPLPTEVSKSSVEWQEVTDPYTGIRSVERKPLPPASKLGTCMEPYHLEAHDYPLYHPWTAACKNWQPSPEASKEKA